MQRAARFAESGALPAKPRLAATVVLMRPGLERGIEVYLQRRPPTMAFAAGMYVFPGGVVDPRDASDEVGWLGHDPAWWAATMALTESDARAVVCAAVREVFEECGVLLAGPSDSSLVGEISGPEWEEIRRAMAARELSFMEMLKSRGLHVRSDLLTPWARWLTPEFEQQRYDTFFFLARMPPDQHTREGTRESDHALWINPARHAGLPMLPPTAYTLGELADFPDVEAALAAGRGRDVSAPVQPRIHVDDDGAWLVLA